MAYTATIALSAGSVAQDGAFTQRVNLYNGTAPNTVLMVKSTLNPPSCVLSNFLFHCAYHYLNEAMKLSNQEENEINTCKFQIQWRETELKSQRQKFENTEWKLEFENDDYNSYWKMTDKMSGLERDIEQYKKRLAELNEKSRL